MMKIPKIETYDELIRAINAAWRLTADNKGYNQGTWIKAQLSVLKSSVLAGNKQIDVLPGQFLSDNMINQLKNVDLADVAELFKPKKNYIKLDNYLDNVEQFWQAKPFFYNKERIFWLWSHNQHRYEMADDVDLMNLLDDILGMEGQTITNSIKSNYLEAFKRVGRKHIAKQAPVKWIQFQDKAYSLNSGKIYTVTPDYFFCNPIPWELGDSTDTPIIDKLFIDWVGEENKQKLYELIAYCCYTDYPIQLLFCLVGSGRNGKGCFLKILDKFLGSDNVTSTSLDLISGNNKSRFESFRLYKKLLALMGETNFGILSNTSLLKQLTGGDKIGFEKKGKDPFSDYNYAKIIIASNSLPTTTDTSDGFYRRWDITEFNNEFPEGRDITITIPDIEYHNLARKVIEILPRLLDSGKFTGQGSIEERKNMYILSSNPLPVFLHKHCKKEDTGWVSYNELYAAYIGYLRQMKKRKVSRKEFKQALEDEGYWVEKEAKSIDGEWKVGYYIDGIVFDIFDKFTKIPTQNPIYRTEWEFREKKQKCQKSINNSDIDVETINIQTPRYEHTESTYLKCAICDDSPCTWLDHVGEKRLCDVCKRSLECSK